MRSRQRLFRICSCLISSIKSMRWFVISQQFVGTSAAAGGIRQRPSGLWLNTRPAVWSPIITGLCTMPAAHFSFKIRFIHSFIRTRGQRGPPRPMILLYYSFRLQCQDRLWQCTAASLRYVTGPSFCLSSTRLIIFIFFSNLNFCRMAQNTHSNTVSMSRRVSQRKKDIQEA